MESQTGGATSQQFRSVHRPEPVNIGSRFDKKFNMPIILWKDVMLLFRHALCATLKGNIVPFLMDDSFKVNEPLRIGIYPGEVLDVIEDYPAPKCTTPSLFSGRYIRQAVLPLSSDKARLSTGSPTFPSVQKKGELPMPKWTRLETQFTDDYSALWGQMKTDAVQWTHSEFSTPGRLGPTSWLSPKVDSLSMQDRIHIVLNQRYYLHELCNPRLFIILPVSAVNAEDEGQGTPPRKFRLFFLCEPASHTAEKSAGLLEVVHPADHEGYEIRDFDGFVTKYGAYAITLMQLFKYSFRGTGFIVPHSGANDMLQRIYMAPSCNTTNDLNDAIDSTIKTLQDRLDGVVKQTQKSEGMERDTTFLPTATDLGQLASYLDRRDEEGFFGGLLRCITAEGHVKWLCSTHCIYHHPVSDMQSLVGERGCSWNVYLGSLTLAIKSDGLCHRWRNAFGNMRMRDLQELHLSLDWPATLDNLSDLFSAITNLGVVRLVVDGTRLSEYPSVIDRQQGRWDPIWQIAWNERIQCVELIGFKDIFKRCGSRMPLNSRLKVLSIDSPKSPLSFQDDSDIISLENTVLRCRSLERLKLTVLSSSVAQAIERVQDQLRDLKLLIINTPEGDVVSSTLEYSDAYRTSNIASLDVIFGPGHPADNSTKLSDVFRHYGWFIRTLETNNTLQDYHVALLGCPIKRHEKTNSILQGYHDARLDISLKLPPLLTSLVVNPTSLSDIGLSSLEWVLHRSKNLQHLSLDLEGLHRDEKLEKALLLSHRYKSRTNSLILRGDNPSSWMPRFAEKFPRPLWPKLSRFQVDYPKQTLSSTCEEWITSMSSPASMVYDTPFISTSLFEITTPLQRIRQQITQTLPTALPVNTTISSESGANIPCTSERIMDHHIVGNIVDNNLSQSMELIGLALKSSISTFMKSDKEQGFSSVLGQTSSSVDRSSTIEHINLPLPRMKNHYADQDPRVLDGDRRVDWNIDTPRLSPYIFTNSATQMSPYTTKSSPETGKKRPISTVASSLTLECEGRPSKTIKHENEAEECVVDDIGHITHLSYSGRKFRTGGDMRFKFGTDMPKTIDIRAAIESCNILSKFALHYSSQHTNESQIDPAMARFQDANDRANLHVIQSMNARMSIEPQNSSRIEDAEKDKSPFRRPAVDGAGQSGSEKGDQEKQEQKEQNKGEEEVEEEEDGEDNGIQFGCGPPSQDMVHELARAATSIFQLAIRINAWVGMTPEEREMDEDVNTIRNKRSLLMDGPSMMQLSTLEPYDRQEKEWCTQQAMKSQSQGSSNSPVAGGEHLSSSFIQELQRPKDTDMDIINNVVPDLNYSWSITPVDSYRPDMSSLNNIVMHTTDTTFDRNLGSSIKTTAETSYKDSEITPQKYRKRIKHIATVGRCFACHTSATPLWRRGPDGPRSLCNACGLHYAGLLKRQNQQRQK